MSWGEVEKINSWAKKGVPLNHLIWLNDYKTYGENSYVFRDRGIWDELSRSRISGLDNSVADSVMRYFIDEKPDSFGVYISNRYGLESYKNMDIVSCLSDPEVLSKMANDSTVFSAMSSQFDNILQDDDTNYSITKSMLKFGFEDSGIRTLVKSSTYLGSNLINFDFVKTVENLKVTDSNVKTEALPSGKYYIISAGQRASNFDHIGYPLTIMHTINGGSVVPGDCGSAKDSYGKYVAVNDYFYDLYMNFPTALIGDTGISETGMLKYINLDEV